MKKFGMICLAMVVGLPIAVNAGIDLGLVATTDDARFPIHCLDSSGFDVQPDSVHVLVWYEGEATVNSASYSVRTATGGATATYVDSLRLGSATQYYFVDDIADLDNGEGNGVYTGDVILWDAQIGTHNLFSFTIVDVTRPLDSLLNIGDEVARLGDSTDAYDDWVGQQTEIVNLNGWNPSSGQVLADVTAISGDATAADNLETMLDGTGGQKLTLSGLHIRASGDDTALVATGSGLGYGAFFYGGADDADGIFSLGQGTGSGLFVRGGASASASGLTAYAAAGSGATISADGGASALLVANKAGDGHAAEFSAGSGGGQGFHIASDSSDGLAITGGAQSVNNGSPHAVEILSVATGDDAVRITSRGHGHGLWLDADSALGVLIQGGLMSAGLRVEGGTTSGNAVEFISADTGMYVNGSVADLVSTIVGTATPTDTNSSGEALAVMPDHWSAADSTGYQGSAAGLDSATVARAVWNAPSLNHTNAGTFGEYLDAPITGVSGGSGAYSVTLVAFDTAVDQSVAGVRLAVWNSDQSSLLAVAGTGSNGAAAVNLDAGSYLVAATAPGYSFAAFHSLTLTGALTDSVFGFQFDPGSPESPSLCRVYGYLYRATGDPESGATIAVHLPTGVTLSGSLIISPQPASTTTDATGYFYLDLLPTASLTGSPQYEFTISRTDGTILRKRLTVPDTDNWQLTW